VFIDGDPDRPRSDLPPGRSAREPVKSLPATAMKPERGPWAGSPVVDGIAIGRAVVWAKDPEPRSVAGTAPEEHARLARVLLRATRGVEDLVRLLPAAEAELFLPEVAILAELGPLLLARVDEGATAEDAVNEATSQVSTDLLLDARARLLDGLAHSRRSVESLLEGRDGDRVLVTESLTPSVVAVLPVRVVGIVAASDGAAQSRGEYTSHAVILARGRGIPLAFVPADVVLAIADDDTLVLDTTGSVASVWVGPDESIVVEAQQRRSDWFLGCAQEEANVAAPLVHLGLEVHVNIGSVYEHLPASADGIGLLRTELVFSGHARAPSEVEQFAALRAIAAPIGSSPVVVRLFDAGGDKPLAWLQAPAGSPRARGLELLFMHPQLLDTQLRAIVRAAEHVSARVLLPLVRCADDVERIRALSHGKVSVGAMIETPSAVDQIDELAAAADFICIGTNDLFAMVTGQEHADSTLSFDTRALRMVERVITVAHAHARKVSVCGEIAGDIHGARILVGLGVDAISVATSRFAKVKLSLRDVTIDDCRRITREALK
jgi:phosphoenolpyruvate-protein kinase (PTS system EI component)